MSIGSSMYLALGCAFLSGLSASRVDTPLPALSQLSRAALAAGDFNGDGLEDLVVGHRAVRTSEGRSVLTVLLSRGNGTFSIRPVLFPDRFDARAAYRVITADFNRDGRLDLAFEIIDSGFDRHVEIVLGQGDGSFRHKEGGAGGDRTSDLAAADMNGDGIPDLVVADSEGPSPRIDVFFGRGDGTFERRQTYRDPATPERLMSGDVNGDGKPDVLALMSGDGPRLDVLLNDGTGKLSRGASLSLRGRSSALAAADLNRDGALDVATLDAGSDTVQVFLGRGDGTFAPETSARTGARPVGLAVGDVTGDGAPDLVTVNAGSGDVSVLSVGAAGEIAVRATLPGVRSPGPVTPANVDGKDGPEIVLTSTEPGSVTVLFPDRPTR